MRTITIMMLTVLATGCVQAQNMARDFGMQTLARPHQGWPSKLTPLAPLNNPKLVDPDQDAPTIISTTPKGSICDNTYNSSSAFYQTPFGMAMETTMDGNVGAYVKDDAGNYYIKNPISKIRTDTWIKGTLKGDTIYFQTPQCLMVSEDKEELKAYYVYNMTLNENQTNFIPDSTERNIKFVDEEGVLRQVSPGIVGLTTETGAWTGYGDYDIVIRPQYDEALARPDDVEFKPYILSYDNSYGTRSGVRCMVGLKDNIFYLDSLCSEMGDYCITGTLSGENVSIDMPQYLGPDMEHGYHLYAFGAVSETEPGEDGQPQEYTYLANHLSFAYNAEDASFVSDSVLVLNMGKNEFYYLYGYRRPQLRLYEPKAGKPEKSVFADYMAYTKADGYGGIKFVLPEFSTEGDYLVQDSLFYNIYFDGKLYTFAPPLYSKLSEPMTDVPASFTDNFDFMVKGLVRTLYYYSDYSTIGVQIVYKYNGTTMKSDIATLDLKEITGLKPAHNGRCLVSTTYFDVSGRQVSASAHGLLIRRDKFDDNSTVTKLVTRN